MIERESVIGVSAIEVGRVDSVVKQCRFLFVLTMHGFEAAFFLQPFANQTDDVNAPGVWRVVERVVLDVRAVVEHRVQTVRDTFK